MSDVMKPGEQPRAMSTWESTWEMVKTGGDWIWSGLTRIVDFIAGVFDFLAFWSKD